MIGTSASAPHVAGVAALMFSLDCDKMADLLVSNPGEAALLVKDAIMDGVDYSIYLDQTVSQGRLNANTAFLNLAGWCNGAPITSLAINNLQVNNNNLEVFYNTNDFSRHDLSVYDITGRLIYKTDFRPFVFQEKMITIDLTSLGKISGNFIVTINNESEKISKTISLIQSP